MTSETKPFPKFMASDGLIILATSENNGFITGTVIRCDIGLLYDLGYHCNDWGAGYFEDIECKISIK